MNALSYLNDLIFFGLLAAMLGCGTLKKETYDEDTDTGTDTTEDTASSDGDADAGDGGDDRGPGRQNDLVGVNLSGAEFGSEVPGVLTVSYIFPKPESLDYFLDKGMNVFRIPFLWERMQRELYGALFDRDLSHLKDLVTAATDRGAYAILDPHNYARYNDRLIGAEIDDAAFADFWARLAAEFMDDDHVIFGLMNEPHDMETEQWFASATAATAAIRETGAENLILVPGNGWTGAHSWGASYYGTSNQEAFSAYEDPGGNFAIEVHQYLDSDSSGTHTTCVSETVGVERLESITAWAEEGNYRLFLGELGADATDLCMTAVDNTLGYVGDHSDVWLGWSWWSAGPWWGGYFMSIEPDEEMGDKPQMATLERHL